jgi:FtsP/CotA-like multicopper oxidase with cupredoxin domain
MSNHNNDPAAMDPSRRRFLAVAGALGFSAVGSAFAPDSIRNLTHAAQAQAQHDHEVALAAQDEMGWEEMDQMHEAGILRFPAETQGTGGLPLEYQMDGDVKVFRLTAAITPWEWDTDQWVDAWTYNGTVPGPEIRVTEGDKVRVIVTNELPESTAVHWHGLIVPNDQDGVPFITQPPITPGHSFTYEFRFARATTVRICTTRTTMPRNRCKWACSDPSSSNPKNREDYPAYDREFTIVLNEGPIAGYSINGKGFPATQPFVVKQGETVLFRYMNEGAMIHPMHLHGMPQKVVATDGWVLPVPYMADTINVAPGQRIDVLVHATELGVWAFHCHILSHAESNHGMFGMVTALIVDRTTMPRPPKRHLRLRPSPPHRSCSYQPH